MLTELIQFTNSLDPELKTIGMTPKEGLHIMLKLEELENTLSISTDFRYEIYSKKDKEISSSKKYFASLAQLAWMVNTNKCFDLPSKGIHSCSPYCLAFKRESIKGGAKFNDAKVKIYGRINAYFDKAIELLAEDSEKELAKVFKFALNSEEKVHSFLDQIEEYSALKDAEYIVFYLDVPIEKYKVYNDIYLGGKLFNTEKYNIEGNDGLIYGTSNFLNGFNLGKPFLMHQSATFDITGRISANGARTLFEFENIAGRRILPNPLPIFVYEEERDASITLFKEDALDGGNRRGYREIIEELQKRLKKELGNYYLLFYKGGETKEFVKDFDFVSKFEYELKDKNNENWQIKDLFGGKYKYSLENVFELERLVLPLIFNNALIVRTKTSSMLFKYFDDIDAQYCKTANTYLLVMTYRKIFYDFIYKSNRTGLTQRVFEDILLTSILDDIRLDKFENNHHSEDLNIRQKLNVLFSLHQNFQPFKQDARFMASNVNVMREYTKSVIAKTESINDDEQFAFLSGQVTRYLHTKSKSSDRSYNKLESILQKTTIGGIKDAIDELFRRYKHEKFSKNFRNIFSEVNGYAFKQKDSARPFKHLMPLFLAGYFSECYLFADKVQEPEIEEYED